MNLKKKKKLCFENENSSANNFANINLTEDKNKNILKPFDDMNDDL